MMSSQGRLPIQTESGPSTPGISDSPSITTADRKRQRRTRGLVACEACQRRKSRCEDINQQGCLRCRTLGTMCVLLGEPVLLPDSIMPMVMSPRPPSEDTPRSNLYTYPDEQLLSELLKRARSTDRNNEAARLRTAHAPITPARRQSAKDLRDDSSSPPLQDGPYSPSPHLKYYSNAWLAAAYALQLEDETKFLSVVDIGVVADHELRAAHQLLQQTHPKILPIPHLGNPTLLGSNSFLDACIMYHIFTRTGFAPPSVTRQTQYQRLLRLIQIGLSTLHHCDPSEDLIVALLVLSHCPYNTFEHRPPRLPDSLGAADLAIRMAISTGLDESVYRAESMGRFFGEPHRELTNRLVLWYTIAHRVAWIDVFTSPTFSPRVLKVPSLTALFGAGPPCAALIHLYSEARMLDLVQPLATAVRQLRCVMQISAGHVDNVIQAYEAFHAHTEHWRSEVSELSIPSAPYLLVLSRLVEVPMCFKLAGDVGTALPSPLVIDDRTQAMMHFAGAFLCRARDLIETVISNEFDIALLPAHAITTCIMAYGVSWHSPSEAFTDTLKTFRELLCHLHPALLAAVQKIEGIAVDPAWRDMQRHETSAANDVQAFISNLDFLFDCEFYSTFDIDPGF